MAEDLRVLESTNRVANEVKEISIAVLESIRNQNEILKRAKKKLYEIGIQLGLSRELIKTIERRQYGDKIIVGLFMLVIVIVFVVLFYLFRWWSFRSFDQSIHFDRQQSLRKPCLYLFCFDFQTSPAKYHL